MQLNLALQLDEDVSVRVLQILGLSFTHKKTFLVHFFWLGKCNPAENL
jgi:hypothetical protein